MYVVIYRGPNHASDPLICRICYETKKLQIILTKRPDTFEWGLPGGITEAGEVVSVKKLTDILKQSFSVEQTEPTSIKGGDSSMKLDRDSPMQTAKTKFLKMFENANDRNILYVGVVDDPRNTDNSWMETIAVLIYLDGELSQLQLPVKRVSDLESAECNKYYWVEYQSGMSLFASHSKFVAAAIRKLYERKILDANGEVIVARVEVHKEQR